MIIADSNYLLSNSNRSFHYGDGCFTTIKVIEQQPQLIEWHIARLRDACDKLAIANMNWQTLESEIQSQAKKLNLHTLKVHISRGDGGRGYGYTEILEPIVMLSVHEIPDNYASLKQVGMKVSVAQCCLAKQPLLAKIKHNNRLEQVLIKQEIQQSTFDDMLVLDTDLTVIEGSSANCFWYSNDRWFTPDLTNCGVEGVMRNHILHLFAKNEIKYEIVFAKTEDVMAAQSVFFCNSLMGIMPIHSLKRQSEKTTFSNVAVEDLLKHADFKHL